MNEALARDLYIKYPKILTRDGDEVGLEVGDGWYDLLDTLCSQIQHHIDWKNGTGQYEKYKDLRKEGESESVPQLVAEQIKEKFGGLTIYYDGGVLGHKFAFKSFGPLGNPWYICEYCGLTKVEVSDG